MMKDILICQRCDLYLNQKPLLDNLNNGDVMWVGLSSKKVDSTKEDIPLSRNTNSGRIIQNIEDSNVGVSFYKTNLVKCLPLDEKLKIRYPNKKEKESCYYNLELELSIINPKVVFLLGLKTADFVLSKYKERIRKLDVHFKYKIYPHNEINFVPIHHPSYIYMHKGEKMYDYTNSVSLIIENLMKNE